MKLAVFLSDYKTSSADIASRFATDDLGIIFVSNGVNYVATKENGKSDKLLQQSAKFYVLTEDLESRGFTSTDLPSNVTPVTYSDVVDLIFNQYEKIVWL